MENQAQYFVIVVVVIAIKAVFVIVVDVVFSVGSNAELSGLHTANLKCHYDQILDIHFFTVSDTIGLS